MKEFQIGDKVGHVLRKSVGVVEDVLYSNATDKYVYSVKWDCLGMPSKANHDAEELYLIDDREYRYEITLHENLVLAVLYERVNNDEFEVARGHGHIIHEGVVGYTQAAAYALKKIMLDVNGGELPMRGDQQDV